MGWAGTERLAPQSWDGESSATPGWDGGNFAVSSSRLREDGMLGGSRLGWREVVDSRYGRKEGFGRSRLWIRTQLHAVSRGSRIQRTEAAPQLQAETERIRWLQAGMKGSRRFQAETNEARRLCIDWDGRTWRFQTEMKGAHWLRLRCMMQLQVARHGSRIQKTKGTRGFRLELRELGSSRLTGSGRRLPAGTEEDPLP